MTRLHACERGSAMILIVVVIVILTGMSAAYLTLSLMQSEGTLKSAEGQKMIEVADGQLGRAAYDIIFKKSTPNTTDDATAGDLQGVNDDGVRWRTEATDSGNGTWKIQAVARGAGRPDQATIRAIEASFTPGGPHPLMDYAIYAGNQGTGTKEEMRFGGQSGGQADVINGKVYAHGDIRLTGNADIMDDVHATGVIQGNTPSGGETEGFARIPPPDLKAMKYEEIADYKVTSGDYAGSSKYLPDSDPRHIFAKNFRDDLSKTKGFQFSNTNFFLGDRGEGPDLTEVSIHPDGNRKIYYIDGNLWIEPQGEVAKIIKSPPEGTQITIVVKGNIYFSDYLSYDMSKDAVMFIAMSDGESYTDTNNNNQYDAGEPILQDDGNGVYNGNKEGSGNIMFGDPNGGPLGHVHGFLYAENNFEDHVLDGTSGKPLPFEVTGFASAGQQFRINRDFGGQHAQMKVTYDARLRTGAVTLPGFPESAGSSAAAFKAWRTIPPPFQP